MEEYYNITIQRGNAASIKGTIPSFADCYTVEVFDYVLYHYNIILNLLILFIYF